MAVKMNGEVPFPQAGEGVFLCFPVSAIAKLEELHGIGDYFGRIEAGLNNASGTIMLDCLRVGLFKRSADGKRERVAIDEDEVVFPVTESAEPILNALSLSASGKTYAELIAEAAARQAKMESELDALDKGAADEGDTDPTET